MRKIIISLITVLTVGGLVAGATSAYFSDLGNSSDNTIVTVEDTPMPSVIFEDNFEDGAIDSSLWIIGGGKRCAWNPGGGSWQYWNEEITDATDGYLQARTAGPTSGITCGGEAWTRTL